MSKIIRCSFYGAPGEKMNEFVAMVARKPCPECDHGKVYINPYTDKTTMKYCERCHGDGWLDNPVKFNPNAMTCASNDYPFGTWLRVNNPKYKERHEIFCDRDEYEACLKYNSYCLYTNSILVIVTDVMASWLNSQDGKYQSVCSKCHSKFEWKADGRICQVHNCNCGLIPTRDIDLTFGAFGLLAPHSVGLLEVSVEHE